MYGYSQTIANTFIMLSIEECHPISPVRLTALTKICWNIITETTSHKRSRQQEIGLYSRIGNIHTNRITKFIRNRHEAVEIVNLKTNCKERDAILQTWNTYKDCNISILCMIATNLL